MLKQYLEVYRKTRERKGGSPGDERTNRQITSALIPSLRPSSLQQNLISGPGWALVGDAAGFVDPITCEGIYFALRSGELLATSLTEGHPDFYADACKADFLNDFICAAEFFEKFYSGRFLDLPSSVEWSRQPPEVLLFVESWMILWRGNKTTSPCSRRCSKNRRWSLFK